MFSLELDCVTIFSNRVFITRKQKNDENETEEKSVARYLVGPYNNSWNFMDAIEKAQDGDTIEFENGYVFQWPTDEVIEINKSLHFVGHVVPNPNGNGRMFNKHDWRLPSDL